MVGLDPKSQRLVKDLLREEVARGVTVFMSTHLLADAEALATRIGIVDHGKLIGLGTLGDLRQQARHDGSLEDVFLTLTAEGTNGT
jgi:ABC-2 type transport system ATP-binding protein